MEKVQYRVRQVYGKDTMYPANGFADMICKLTGRKTITADDLEILKTRGHELERVI